MDWGNKGRTGTQAHSRPGADDVAFYNGADGYADLGGVVRSGGRSPALSWYLDSYSGEADQRDAAGDRGRNIRVLRSRTICMAA